MIWPEPGESLFRAMIALRAAPAPYSQRSAAVAGSAAR